MLSTLLRPQAKKQANYNTITSGTAHHNNSNGGHDVEQTLPPVSPFTSGARGNRPERTLDGNNYFEQGWDESRKVSGGGGNEDGALGKGKATQTQPLLPIFSAPHLDSIPVYTLVHTIRAEICERVDTTLTWDQLRSPQVSQFLVKPILGKLEQPPVSKGLIYSLMANCLQFNKEAAENPGNASVYLTRSMLTELLALKLLREFSTLELIDCLSYDFYPLQGMPAGDNGSSTPAEGPSRISLARSSSHVTRVSTLEIAVRAQAKRFLSHPLVIQQLDAIWSGIIVFHSEPERNYRQFGNMTWRRGNRRRWGKQPELGTRRTATLYDAQMAGILKLSRLRVPRYRHVTSTLSLGVLLVLYVMVLQARSAEFTSLEGIFWIWSFGFMMDEIIGLSENGFALHMISLWNAIDVLIYVLFLAFYIMRLISIVLPDRENKLAELSYDLLASCAIFLFPRIFSVLDHYEYFSQLILGFKYMAVDLMAILLLIVIACSGFFVAFTLAFGRDLYSPGVVAFSLFQILMGFTPTAWESWHKYDILGKTLLTIFLFITHYLIFTLLVTVLTNSFATVIKNAHEEHHFLTAATTLSLVKSENLFSYVAPFNLIGFLLLPLRSILPFMHFVRINRIVIQLVHFPILFIIFIYERTILVHNSFESAESIRNQRAAKLGLAGYQHDATMQREPSFLSRTRGRERSESMDSVQTQMLEEVFRRPLNISSNNNTVNRKAAAMRHGQSLAASPILGVRSWAEDIASAASAGRGKGGIAGMRNRMRPFQRFSSEDVVMRRAGSLVGSPRAERAFPGEQIGAAAVGSPHLSGGGMRASRPPSRASQARNKARKKTAKGSDDDGDDEGNSTARQRNVPPDSQNASDSEPGFFPFPSRTHSPNLNSAYMRSGAATPRGSMPARGIGIGGGGLRGPYTTSSVHESMQQQQADGGDSSAEDDNNSSPRLTRRWPPAVAAMQQRPVYHDRQLSSSLGPDRSRIRNTNNLQQVRNAQLQRQPYSSVHLCGPGITTITTSDSSNAGLSQNLNPLSAYNTQWQSVPNLAQLRRDYPSGITPTAAAAHALELDLAEQEIQRESMLSSSFETQMAAVGKRGNEEIGRMVLERIGNLERGFGEVREVLEDVRELSLRARAGESTGTVTGEGSVSAGGGFRIGSDGGDGASDDGDDEAGA